MQQANSRRSKIVRKILGEILLKERLKQRKSARVLADEYDLQKSMISRLENGKNDPKLSSILSISEALGLKYSELFAMLEDKLPEGFTLIDL